MSRVERFLAQRQLFDPALIAHATTVAADGGCRAADADDFVARAVASFALSPEPIDVGWYTELSRVSAVAADIAGVMSTPGTDAELAAQGLAYYRAGDPAKPVVYEDFLPASAAGILRSNLDSDAAAADGTDHTDNGEGWLAGAIGHHLHDPYDLYEKAAS